MSADTSVERQSISRPIHRSRGAQNTYDPKVTGRPGHILSGMDYLKLMGSHSTGS